MVIDTCQRCGGNIRVMFGEPTCLQCGHGPAPGRPAPPVSSGTPRAPEHHEREDPEVVAAQLAGWLVETVEDLRRLQNVPQTEFSHHSEDAA